MHTTPDTGTTLPATDAPFVFSLGAVSAVDGPEPARAMLQESQAKMGMIPNMYARMVNLPALMRTYAVGYEGFRAESGFSPAEQEVVFLSISHANGCEYCVAAHSFLGDKASHVPPAVTDAIRDGRAVPDERLGALSSFTRHVLSTRGRPTRAAAEAFLAAGFSEPQILAVVLAIAVKTISNYSNHMFETPLDDVFAGRAWRA
jgi:uncharacterized peroxidase-related enzyme